MPYQITKKEMQVSENEPIRIQLRTESRNIPLHWHEYFEIEMVLDGEGTNTINGTDYAIGKGTLCLFSTTDFHSIVLKTPGLRVFHVCIDQNILDFDIVSSLLHAEKNGYYVLNEVEYARVYMLMVMCLEESGKNGVFHQKCMCNIIEIILLLLLEKATGEKRGIPASKNHIMKAISYMEMNFFNDPSLEETAAYVGLNKNYFCTMFRREAGKPFVRYLNDIKLGYAKKLLSSTELSVAEVCAKSGFHSLSSFLHEFKRRYETTPLQYRQKKRGDGSDKRCGEKNH